MLQRPGETGGGEGTGEARGGERGLYILLFGSVKVSRRVGSAAGVSTSTLTPGDHFGGIGILHRNMRQATLRAHEPCGLFVVSADEFRRTLRRNKLEEAAERAIFVASVPMFHRLPWERLLRMVSTLESAQYGHGETIVRQGETPQGLYILYDGRCTVQRELLIDDQGRTRTRKMHLETLMPRDTYGGDAILHGTLPRLTQCRSLSRAVVHSSHWRVCTVCGAGMLRSQTSLVAETDATVLFMPRQEFSPAHLTEEARPQRFNLIGMPRCTLAAAALRCATTLLCC
jgi:CRP-like cAMP-binding protein